MALLDPIESQIAIPDTQIAIPAPEPTEQATRFISPEATVANQLTTLLASDSPLIRQAETRSEEEAQRMGLLSSSLAVGAGRRAAIQAALPIAQQDAETFARSGLLTQEGAQRLSEIGRQADITSALQEQEARSREKLSAQEAVQETGLLRTRGEIESGQIAQRGGEQRKLAAQEAQAVERLETLRSNASFRELETKLAHDFETNLNDIASSDRGAYSDSVRGIFQQYSNSYANIQTNPDLNLDAKRIIINNLNKQTQAQVNVLSKLYGLSISWGAREVPTI
jgi:hypothetical protein